MTPRNVLKIYVNCVWMCIFWGKFPKSNFWKNPSRKNSEPSFRSVILLPGNTLKSSRKLFKIVNPRSALPEFDLYRSVWGGGVSVLDIFIFWALWCHCIHIAENNCYQLDSTKLPRCFVKTQLCLFSELVALGCGLIMCMTNKLPDHFFASRFGITLWKTYFGTLVFDADCLLGLPGMFLTCLCLTLLLLLLSRFSRVRLCVTPEMAAHQAPPSLGFSRQEHWSRLPFPSQCMKVKSESEVAQSFLTPSDPMDCSLPGSCIHGICQARVLEWVAIAFSVVWYYLA